jgi:translation initiation factor 1 (eIF-1/SUI1)
MDLFASAASNVNLASNLNSTPAAASLTSTLSTEAAAKIVTVSIEKVKNRTLTAIYEFDYSLDKTIGSPDELLSKLKKKICNSNGFIRKPVEVKKKEEKEDSDSDSDSNDDNSNTAGAAPAIGAGPASVSMIPQYVIQGNHSNAICRYIYSLGIKNIIRTGTA